jgi:hypothetical protein
MDVRWNDFDRFLLALGPALLIYLVITALIMAGGRIAFTLQKFLLANHLPENRSPSLMERLWSGFLYGGGVVFQIFFLMYFTLPFLLGAFFLSLAEANYLQNPESAPWNLAAPPAPGIIFLLFAVLTLGMGITISKNRISFYPRISVIFHYLNRIDAHTLVLSSVISAVFAVLAIFFSHPVAAFGAVLAAIAAVICAGIAVWMLTDIDLG